jgi:hypothetical protein
MIEATEQVEATTEGLAELARPQLRGVLTGCEPGEVAALRAALTDGRVTGQRYWDPDHCVGCVLGSIAHARGTDGLAGDAMAYTVPTVYALEDWAWPIRPGDVPDHTQPEDSGPFKGGGGAVGVVGRRVRGGAGERMISTRAKFLLILAAVCAYLVGIYVPRVVWLVIDAVAVILLAAVVYRLRRDTT